MSFRHKIILCENCMELVDVTIPKKGKNRFLFTECLNNHSIYLDKETGKNGTVSS